MSIYSDKLAHTQVVINCLYSVAHLCTSEVMLAHNLGALNFDDVISYNLLTTLGCLVFRPPVYAALMGFFNNLRIECFLLTRTFRARS